MKYPRKLIPAAMVLAATFSLHSITSTAGVLYPDASLNTDLGTGTYLFAGLHTPGVFVDELQFSLDGPGSVTAVVHNVFDPMPEASNLSPKKLWDNHLLTVSLFDDSGTFITAAGVGGTLSASGLVGGETYTLAISGKTFGIFGGAYDGKLNVVTTDPPAVPLPPALPGFVAALMTLGLRRKKTSATLE